MAISKPADKRAWTTDSQNRRSMRVLLSVPVTVKGKTSKGQDFSEETRTLVVNAHGAMVSLAAQVARGQKVSITNLATEQTLDCKVNNIGLAQAGKTQIGLE